jgi:hypothetical protein
MKKQQKIAKLVLSKETLDRMDLEKVKGGVLERNVGNVGIIETDTPSECFC